MSESSSETKSKTSSNAPKASLISLLTSLTGLRQGISRAASDGKKAFREARELLRQEYSKARQKIHDQSSDSPPEPSSPPTSSKPASET